MEDAEEQVEILKTENHILRQENARLREKSEYHQA